MSFGEVDGWIAKCCETGVNGYMVKGRIGLNGRLAVHQNFILFSRCYISQPALQFGVAM